MTTALALVVDDSRMARHMLSKMLKEQGIDVDTVESGEEALGYLCSKKPTMIFMDHTMPGMDGFQTLRAIKNDPHTSAIPIIMYTSKEGEVYESQARALGAVDVIPKTLKPLQLAKVLEKQNLLPGQKPVAAANVVAINRSAANDVVIVETGAAEEPAPAPRREPQTAEARSNETKHAELQDLESRLQALTEQLQTLNSRPVERRAANRSYRLQFFGLALCIVLIGILLMYNNQISRQLNEMRLENSNLKQSLEEQNSQARNIQSRLESRLTDVSSQSAETNRRFYESLEWALNQEGRFAFGEKPFNDKLTDTLSRLADNLSSVGFQGEIQVRSHLGRFCTLTADTGETVLPDAGQPMSSCEVMVFDPNQMDTAGTEQTQGFAAFLPVFDAEFGDSIRLVLSTAGDRRPLARYPLPDPDMDASRWNDIATRNQRIEISINPD